MSTVFRKLALCLLAISALVPMFANAQGVKVALQADDGNWFTRCNQCQKTVDNRFPDTATTHVKAPTPDATYARFEVVDVGGGKIALKADSGKYVARCNNCIIGGAKPDSVAVHVTDATQSYAQFTPELLANGKYAFKSDTGKYMARCNNCSPGAAYPNTVTVHATDPNKEPYAQWNVIPVSFPKGSKISLQADDGNWFTRCNQCQKTVDNRFPDTVTAHVKAPTPDAPYARFEVVDMGGGKIALKADSGKYLARCNNCIVGGAKPDSVTLHVTDATQSYAQFTPELLANGKYAFKSDTGKYVARCNNCSPGAAYPNTVTVHATDPNKEPYAQWNVIFIK